MKRLPRILLVCLVPPFATAQSLFIGPDGAHVDEDRAVVLAPAPVQAGQALAMHELPVSGGPATFVLNYGTNGRAGPFELTDGTEIGSKQSPYTLRFVDHGMRFTLQSPATNAAFGPFTATNGAPVVLANRTPMTFMRVPPELVVTLNHPDRIAQRPSIGLAPFTPALRQALYDLRARFVGIANRYDYDTSDIALVGVPRIRNNITGNTYEPTVKRSDRDKESAAKSAEQTAILFLDKLFTQAFTIRSQAITDDLTFHFRLPAGDYVFCAMQRIREPGSRSIVGSATAVWWTALHADGERPLSLSLTADNAIDWRDVFTLTR